MMTGVNIVHVPYRGQAPALADLLAGQVQVMFPSIIAPIEYIIRLRALAVTAATRSDTLPDIPTVSEFVPDYEDLIGPQLAFARSCAILLGLGHRVTRLSDK
jgi:hypothetical protein